MSQARDMLQAHDLLLYFHSTIFLALNRYLPWFYVYNNCYITAVNCRFVSPQHSLFV